MKTAIATAITLSAAALAGCASSDTTNGSDAAFPDNLSSLTFEVPFDAGGTTDTIARLMAPMLEEELDVPVQVVNMSERDGQAGFEALAESDPNGAMVGFTNLPSAVTSYLGTEAGYDKDSFAPLGAVTSLSTVIAVHEDSDIDDFTDLVDAALAAPGDVTLAAGALDDSIQVHQIEEATGAEFNKIPFEGGSSGEVTALLGKKVDAIIGAPVAMIPNVESGDFRVIAVFGPERIAALPDSPTAIEQGVDLEMLSRIGLSLSAGTDEETQSALVDAMDKIAASPEFVKKVEALGYEGGFIDPEKFSAEWTDAEGVAQTVIDEEGR
ncbi:tripartite tricarboxylate transporter substrate binding protein [Nocardioides cavernae]|uniref:Tripartite tricarboxylate transporter substrate binding protein n=1 Tax=Nocardioides cavernae TaxID=1921566 RepID=A0ABR8N7V4_9ACTN|nr:tripartite tricarboxylate transporter substrate binding protein [Nocardioides cavernae]MBD3924236.1 tripartite tricarboxylate transporter substrate binding protein [Nocardioides cavernae]MBM7510825.1 tripartite-type tricarboxylate transporter receptor subunit TctC [Nocardioides cavernae]